MDKVSGLREKHASKADGWYGIEAFSSVLQKVQNRMYHKRKAIQDWGSRKEKAWKVSFVSAFVDEIFLTKTIEYGKIG